jgi:hypothetical protein
VQIDLHDGEMDEQLIHFITLRHAGQSVSSTRMMSTRVASPVSTRDPLSCVTTLSSDPLETRSGPCVGIQSRSSSGVARLLDGDPDSGTSSSMKSNAAVSETAEAR